MTPSEARLITRKLPVAPDGNAYIDAVFCGGGTLAVAFLGALRCLDDAGVRVRKVAGTSAGAIPAAAVAADIPIDVLEERVSSLNFEDITMETTSECLSRGDPARAMNNLVTLLLSLGFARRAGKYSTRPLRHWMRSLLRGYGDRFPAARAAGADWHTERELRVVVSDISAGEMRILPDDLPLYGEDPATFSVARAVTLSMSIPLFFEPGSLGGNTIVDGGVLSNFPLGIFQAPVCRRPVCPTLGFCLNRANGHRRDIDSALDVILAMVQTMQVAGDRHYMRRDDASSRIVDIACPDVPATDFAISAADKDALYAAGYSSTKAFLLDVLDWDAHLASRGFKPDGPLP